MGKSFLDRFDMTTFIVTLLIIGTGLIAIYSATYSNQVNAGYFGKQLIFAIAGILLVIGISYIPPKSLTKLIYAFYVFCIILLMLVLVLGKKISGSQSWFSFGGFGIQPSEFMKIATILAVAQFLTADEKGRDINQPLDFIKACLIILLPIGLIMKQPDMGTSLVFLSMILPLFFAAGLSPFALFSFASIPIIAVLSFLGDYYFYAGLLISLIFLIFFKRKFILSAFIFLASVGAGFSTSYIYSHLHPYQQNRIMAVFNPATDPLGTGYNVIQAKVAIGSGGLLGKGFLHGSQTQLKFIPEQWTDFIFCMIGEEFGFVGATFLIILYSILILKLLDNSFSTKNSLFSIALIGFASIFLFHLVINVGMTIGIMPVIGIPLPLVSYGISSLMSFLIMVGISMNTYRHRNIYT